MPSGPKLQALFLGRLAHPAWRMAGDMQFAQLAADAALDPVSRPLQHRMDRIQAIRRAQVPRLQDQHAAVLQPAVLGQQGLQLRRRRIVQHQEEVPRATL
jgi:hypothetical protein